MALPNPPCVLIVDDEPAVRDIMARWVASLGLSARTASGADEALDTLREAPCDLAVIDVMMPGHDGLWLATEVQREHPHTAVVLATAYTSLLEGDTGQPRPIADLLIKPFARDRFALAVDRGRRWRKDALDEQQWHAALLVEVRDRTMAARRELAWRLGEEADEVDALTALLAERVPESLAHGERVARYARSLARELGQNDADEATLDLAARFHDVGRLAMPDALLTKPSPLTENEVDITRRLVDAGAEILAGSRTLGPLAPIVRASREWFSGGGHPGELAGTAIPLASRIIAVADAYDSMTQSRLWRSQLTSTEAISELLRCSDAQFDPDLVVAFLSVLSRH